MSRTPVAEDRGRREKRDIGGVEDAAIVPVGAVSQRIVSDVMSNSKARTNQLFMGIWETNPKVVMHTTIVVEEGEMARGRLEREGETARGRSES